MKHIAVLIVVLGALGAACGDGGLLDGLGERAQHAVVGTTTTTQVPDTPDQGDDGSPVVPATSAAWYNDGITDEAIGLPAYTIQKVWERGNDAGRFIQSSRAEIAVALPGIKFPARLPAEVATVTSQLVYLEEVATLDAGTSAAFGLWEVEPYSTLSGRVAKLTVGADRGDVELGEVRSEIVTAGLTLIWSDGRYRYELFCRASVDEERCGDMMNSATPLRDLLGSST